MYDVVKVLCLCYLLHYHHTCLSVLEHNFLVCVVFSPNQRMYRLHGVFCLPFMCMYMLLQNVYWCTMYFRKRHIPILEGLYMSDFFSDIHKLISIKALIYIVYSFFKTLILKYKWAQFEKITNWEYKVLLVNEFLVQYFSLDGSFVVIIFFLVK